MFLHQFIVQNTFTVSLMKEIHLQKNLGSETFSKSEISLFVICCLTEMLHFVLCVHHASNCRELHQRNRQTP